MRNANHFFSVTITLIFFMQLAGCGILGKEDDEDQASNPHGASFDATGFPALRSSVGKYADCAELQADVRSILTERQLIDKRQRDYHEQKRKRQDQTNDNKNFKIPAFEGEGVWRNDGDMVNGRSDASIGDSSPSDGDDQEGSFTNIQVQGVDEADSTKIGKDHIYYQNGATITVADRKTYKKLGTLAAPQNQLAMHASGSYLVLLSNESDTKTVCTEEATEDGIFTQNCRQKLVQGTLVKIYKAKAGKLPKHSHDHLVEGNFFDSRFIDDRLVLAINSSMTLKQMPSPSAQTPIGIENGRDFEEPSTDSSLMLTSQYNYHIDAEIPAEPVTLDENGQVAGLDCAAIAKPALPDLDFRITKIASIPLNSDPLQITGVLGGGDKIYMSKASVFVAKSGSSWPGWIAPDAEAEALTEFQKKLNQHRETSVLTQINLDGGLHVAATGSVVGLIKDQWSFNHFGSGQLAIFTHTRQASESQQLENHLYVLKRTESLLLPVAAIRGFGNNEDLKAARFVDNKAYAVTFRQIDPLFAFDLSNPEKPMLLGELKIPGFSAYLHPLGADRLIGVGFGNGVEVSLFDVSDPTKPLRIDVLPVGAANAEITNNHRAFYIDPKQQRFGFSVSGSGTLDFLDGSYQTSGAIVIDVESDKLVKKATLTHRVEFPTCFSTDISRMYDLDNKFVTVSASGIVAYDHANLSDAKQKQPFATDCDQVKLLSAE